MSRRVLSPSCVLLLTLSCATPEIVQKPRVADASRAAHVMVVVKNKSPKVAPFVIPLSFDGELLARMAPDQAVLFDSVAGRHFLAFWGDDGRREVVRFEVAAGETYAVACIFNRPRRDRVIRCARTDAHKAAAAIERGRFEVLE